MSAIAPVILSALAGLVGRGNGDKIVKKIEIMSRRVALIPEEMISTYHY